MKRKSNQTECNEMKCAVHKNAMTQFSLSLLCAGSGSCIELSTNTNSKKSQLNRVRSTVDVIASSTSNSISFVNE